MRHIKTILVPIDGSPASIEGLAQAAVLADDLGARIDVLHVVTPQTVEAATATAATRPAKEQAEHDMEEAIAAAEGSLRDRLRRILVAGEPVRKILETAAAEKPDLIVMGTHGRVGRLHALVGSVAEAVVRNAPCPVLTVRRTDGEDESFAEKIHHRERVVHQARPSR